MRCPTLSELPPPPPDKTGWPWTEESPQLPDSMPDGSEWPRISIVTPNYNYGHFIEETIRSILLQGYPNLEYIIIDGASTDNSVEIIKKYEPWIGYWVSEKDNGQANAINKGIDQCTGDIFNWINSDDRLTKAILPTIAQGIQNHDAFAGVVYNFDEKKSECIANQNLSPVNLILNLNQPVFHQPGLWLRLDNLKSLGYLKESFRYCFDWDLTIRYLANFTRVKYSSLVICDFRLHDISKTVTDQEGFEREREEVMRSLLDDKEYQSLHSLIEIYLRRKNWYHSLSQILNSPSLGKIQKSTKILINACIDPRIRLNRLTFGAVRRVLVG